MSVKFVCYNIVCTASTYLLRPIWEYVNLRQGLNMSELVTCVYICLLRKFQVFWFNSQLFQNFYQIKVSMLIK